MHSHDVLYIIHYATADEFASFLCTAVVISESKYSSSNCSTKRALYRLDQRIELKHAHSNDTFYNIYELFTTDHSQSVFHLYYVQRSPSICNGQLIIVFADSAQRFQVKLMNCTRSRRNIPVSSFTYAQKMRRTLSALTLHQKSSRRHDLLYLVSSKSSPWMCRTNFVGEKVGVLESQSSTCSLTSRFYESLLQTFSFEYLVIAARIQSVRLWMVLVNSLSIDKSCLWYTVCYIFRYLREPLWQDVHYVVRKRTISIQVQYNLTIT